MIRHIVFFTAPIEHHQSVLSGLSILTTIPHAHLLEIGINLRVDQWSKEIDFIVYGEFYDQQALKEFKAHPVYQESIARVKSLRDLRLSVDYDTESAVKSVI
ncbi:Dabb family protein [Liberibacter crescens]|uniref:Dabb family protein n=1 Tax=Liberibacter crescens TaxID=1273132 RepID=UPI0009DB530B|nr:Dabb family protein [Liberibacter crescens]